MSGELREDRAQRLQSLGIVLIIEDPWEAKFKLAQAYSEAHGGSLNMPCDYVVDGVWLRKWLNEQKLIGEGKRKKKLTEEQRRKLKSIGMTFDEKSIDTVWETHYRAVKEYVESAGSTIIPVDLQDIDGVNLRRWINRQLTYARKGKLADKKTQMLLKIGFSF